MTGIECNRDDLLMDEACLVLNTNDKHHNAVLYSLSADCLLCPFTKVSLIEQGKNISLKLKTSSVVTWRVYNDSEIKDYRSANDKSGLLCQFQPNLGEYGIYNLTVADNSCDFNTIVKPSNHYIPLAIIFGAVLCLLFGISLVRSFVKLVQKKLQRGKTSQSSNNTEAPARRRVLSIDTFRGISIIMMIFVNNGAGGYAFLEHATWNGLYVGDLIFPCFVWIMGFCIPISLSSQLAKGNSRVAICLGILKRSILLFIIGVSLNTVAHSADLKTIRIFGVLQRFGVGYFVVSLLYALFSKRKEGRYQNPVFSKIAEFLSLLPQWIFIFIITGVHCSVTFLLPVPGCPTGYVGPGGLHDHGKYLNCTGGAAGYVDKLILGSNHIYDSPTIDQVYGSGPFDPEGLLGCLTTILQTFLGVQAGKILKVHKASTVRILRWLVLALLCGCFGAALHFTNAIPVNKNLWSLSFVFLTTAFALTLLSACYLLIDVTSIWHGGPFRIPGMNALVMYMGHQICYKMFPFHWSYGAMYNHTWQTIAAVWDAAAWTIIAYILHRKRIYITV